jgi:hypothetical protein
MRGTAGLLTAGVFITTSCFTGSTNNGNPDASMATVTFYKDVDPILQQHCQMCHVTGGIAPFPLLTYNDAFVNAAAIVSDTQGLIMPPWGAIDTSACTPRFPWVGNMQLSQTELDTLQSWNAQGAVAGNPADAPPPIMTQPVNNLPGATDLTPAVPYTLTQTTDYFRCYVLDPQITTAGTYITGTNVQPGNETIVHHSLIYSVPAGSTIPPPTDGVANQYDCFGGPGVANPELIAAWAPGGVPYQYPPSVAHPVDAGTIFIMQIHYHPHANASPAPDLTTFQFTTTTTVPQWTVITELLGNYTKVPGASGVGLENPPFLIPPNTPSTTFTMDVTVPQGTPTVQLLSVANHMHLAGTDEQITITRANPTATDPATECFLETPQWNFNWQRAYEYNTPIASLPTVSQGDLLKMRCTYNNTMQNVALASALTENGETQTEPITLGESTLDEMCLGAFWFVYPTPP